MIPWSSSRPFRSTASLEVHLAGGQWIERLSITICTTIRGAGAEFGRCFDYVLRNACERIEGVVGLEIQGPAHTSRSRIVDKSWIDMAHADTHAGERDLESDQGSGPMSGSFDPRRRLRRVAAAHLRRGELYRAMLADRHLDSLPSRQLEAIDLEILDSFRTARGIRWNIENLRYRAAQ